MLRGSRPSPARHDTLESDLEGVRIRTFHPSDMRRLLQLEREAFAQDAWGRDLLDWYARSVPMFLIACVGGALAGYCVVRQSREGVADLDSIAVFRRFRRHGVGTALLRAVLSRLRRRRVPTLALMVRRDNAEAISFYRGHGFMRIRTVPNYYEDGAPAWRMRRPVSRETRPRC